MTTKYALIRWDEEHGRRSLSLPRGVEELASAPDLERLVESTAAMTGRDRRVTDGGDAAIREVTDGE